MTDSDGSLSDARNSDHDLCVTLSDCRCGFASIHRDAYSVPNLRLASGLDENLNEGDLEMLKQIVILAAFAAMSLWFCTALQAQYGGVQVQLGGFGVGVPFGGYGNGYYNGYGNGYRYANGYPFGNRNYGQPSAVYLNGANSGGFRYNSYPTRSYGFGTPRYYTTPGRRYFSRRYR